MQPRLKATVVTTISAGVDWARTVRIFWSADQAIMAIHRLHQSDGCAGCQLRGMESAPMAAV